MTNLPTRAERGDDARDLLRELWVPVMGIEPPNEYKPRGWQTGEPTFSPKWKAYLSKRSIFNHILDINTPEAHLAAALMLVPEGRHVEFERWADGQGRCEISRSGKTSAAWGPTPAHALIAAIARSLDHASN